MPNDKKARGPAAPMKWGFYFWDTADDTIYQEGGHYMKLKEILQVDTNKFYRRDNGEDADNSLAIGWADGKGNFYNLDRMQGDKGKFRRISTTAAALPGTPRVAQGTAIDLYNGELIYVQTEDEVEGLYCLPEEEEKYLDQGMRRISVQEEAWWYRETPTSPEEVPQWYGPFEEQDEALAELHENVPDAEVHELDRQRAASLQETSAAQAIKAHAAQAEQAQDSVLGVLLGVPSGYEPKDDKQSVF